MSRVVAIVVVVLAILVDGFFALVNFFPVAPTRDPGPPRKVLVALDAAQTKWLNDNLVAEFNLEKNANVRLVSVDTDALLQGLQAPDAALLVAVIPRALGVEAMRANAVRSFEDVVARDQIAKDFSFLPDAVLKAAQADGKQVFLPRWSLLDVSVYRESRVRDAVRHWTILRKEIDAVLKAANGRGLPPDYHLELAPESWDAYDRFVIGYYWARRKYGGQPARGRIAHRTGEGLDELIDVVEGVYRAGATDATIARTDSTAAKDYFAWESLYRSHGLFASEMFAGKPLDDDGVLEGLRTGDVYLATVNQMQAFTLHGGAHTGTPPKIDDPDDLGFSPLPPIASVEVNDHGSPARRGQRFSFREDWVWALPAKSPAPQLAYDLARFLWQRDQHARECAALGTMPLRDDVVRERATIFKLVWMDDIFDAAFEAWSHAAPVPDSIASGIGSVYAQLWATLVGERSAIEPATLLAAPPKPRPTPPRVVPAIAADGPLASDEDPAVDVDDELWRGKVELQKEASR